MSWWRRRSDADFAEEIRAHLALEQDALAREGFSERDASALARRAFGNPTSAQERFHESQRSRLVERARQDLGGAARRLWRSPGFAILAMLTLALGIGLSTAVFTVADAVLLRRMPVTDQNRLVLLWGESSDGKSSRIPLTLDEVRAFQRQSRSLQSVAFFAFRGAVPAPIRASDNVFPIRIGLVSGNFFDVLGSRPAIGRALRPEDDIPGAAPVVVLSHRAWERDFGGDSMVVGKAVTMIYTGRTYRIVGVMPMGLEYPQGTDIWAPLVAYGAAGGFLEVLAGELNVLARLAPKASASQAGSELTTFLAGGDALASHRAARGQVQLLPDVVLGDLKPAVLLVSLVAALLLFITCVNVANLLLVRALGRERELELRSALGASRGRIVTQLLGESCLLSIAGGVLGVILASAVTKVFVAVAPPGAPRIDEVHIDGATILAAVLITTAAMLISGVGPALFTSGAFARGTVRSGRRESSGRRTRRLAEALVVAQIALAVVTLATAGLVTKSLMRFERLDLSFDPRHLTVAMLAMNPDELSNAQKQRTALDLLSSDIKSIPGVQAVTPVSAMPFVGDGGGVDGRLSLPGQSSQERAGDPVENLEVAAPNYFATLGLPLLRGRAFTAEDRRGSPQVVIISSSVAKHFWPGVDPVGKRLSIPPDEYTVVGVVPDARYREVQTARPSAYFPVEQWSDVPSTLAVRTADSVADIIPALRRAVADANVGLTLVEASTVQALLNAPRAQPRLNAIVFALFAAAAIALAAVGLLAIISTMVRQRTYELGIRMALGATSGRVGAAVLMRGIVLAVIGTSIGIVGALAAGRLVSALLFDVSPVDAMTLSIVAVLMVVVAALASVVPAHFGMRVDPVIALRRET